MSMAPQDFFPALAPWVATLDDTFPGAWIKPYFAQWEVLHLLSIALLGGASILLNLRLIGHGLTEESPAEVERNVRPWLNLGVVGVIVTGILIGASNAERLYTSEAFTAKMLGLAAAIVLTYGVAMPAARRDGLLGGAGKLWAVVGLAFFGLSLLVFGTAKLVNPGLWHVIFGAALMAAFVTRGALRIVYLLGLGALVIVQTAATHVMIPADDFARLDPVNKAFALAFTAWILAAAGVQVATSPRDDDAGPATKALAYAAVLVWVMTAAAGRWIAFA